MISSLWTAFNGLDTYTKSMAVIGNNIANSSTNGFKYDTAYFGELLKGSQKTKEDTASTPQGQGSQVLHYQTVYLQGPLLSSDSLTDLAISGNGFFQVNDAQGNSYFTRNGNLILDTFGFFATPDGMRLQGFVFDPDSNSFLTELSDLNIPSIDPSKRTTSFYLDAVRLNFETGEAPFHTLEVYEDGAGKVAELGIEFSILPGLGTGDDPWRCVLSPSAGILSNLNVPPASDPPVDPPLASGEIAVDFFFENGALTGVGSPGLVQDIQFELTLNGEPFVITWELVDPDDPERFLPNEIISTTLPIFSGGVFQDGYATGELVGFTVDSNGIIFADYGNNKPDATMTGQIALIQFPSTYGLQKLGETLFLATPESGAPVAGIPKQGARGSIMQASLEQSNVQLADELVRLIVTQQAFNANSLAIRTSSALLETAIQMKRT